MESRCVVCGATFVETSEEPLGITESQFCSSACASLFQLRQQAARELDANRYVHDGDEGYDRQPRPCIVCDSETRLRCARCRASVCHNCIECPNGCDNVANFLGTPL